MAIMIKYKVKEVATDLDVTTKEVIAVLKDKLGVDKKAMTTLNEDELNYIFDYFTRKNAISDLAPYFAVRDDAIKKQQENCRLTATTWGRTRIMLRAKRKAVLVPARFAMEHITAASSTKKATAV